MAHSVLHNETASPIQNFKNLKSRHFNKETIAKLRQVYSYVEDIDLFTGGLSEHRVFGGTVGKTFGCIIG